jgi:hypothetical protein
MEQPRVTHVLVDSIKKSRSALNIIEKSVKENLVVAIDIEGDLRPTGRLSLIQIGLESEAVFLFDVLKCPALLGEKAGLRNLLAGTATKILHDCRNDVAALKGQFNIELAYVWDVQIAHAILKGKNPRTFLVGLNVILQAYAGDSNVNKKKVEHRPGVWEKRPLSALLQVETLNHQQHSAIHHADILQKADVSHDVCVFFQSYAAQDVQHLVKAYRKMLAAVEAKNLFAAASGAFAARLYRALSMSNAEPEPKASVQTLLGETAKAFWRHAENMGLHSQLEDRDCFTRAYEEWKHDEALAGHAWKGGVGAIIFTLKRMKKIKRVKNSSTIVFASSGGISAAVERVETSRQRIAENKHGIEVSTVEFDQVVSVGDTCSRVIEIRNTAQQERSLQTIEVLNINAFSVSLECGALPIQLCNDAPPTRLAVKFEPTTSGIAKSTLSLTFKGTSSGRFTIGRFFEGRWYVCIDVSVLHVWMEG